jgi:2-keto-4-pentenoate hydratase
MGLLFSSLILSVRAGNFSGLFRPVARVLADSSRLTKYVSVTTDPFDNSLASDLAAALATAEATREPIAPLSATVPGLDLETAYRIQRLNIAQRVMSGERTVGHKVGLTSVAIQRQLGVDQPDFGVITDRMVIPDAGSLDAETLIAPRVEAEFAFRFGDDVPVSPTAQEIADRVDGIAVALEIIDSRVTDWKITLIDTVADNASSARIVCGQFVDSTFDALRSLPDAEITLFRDGEEVGRGPGSAVLGDPLVSLEWLASAIGAFGDHFRAGDIVLAGAVAAAVDLRSGTEWEATVPGFPPVRLHTSSKGQS